MADITENNLAPCPFCGGEAAPNTIKVSCKETIALNGQDTFYGVNCVQCGARTDMVIGELTPESAAAKWNQRIPAQGGFPSFQSMSAEDWVRLRDWMLDPKRSKANSFFTAGPAREAAYAFESALDAKPLLT